ELTRAASLASQAVSESAGRPAVVAEIQHDLVRFGVPEFSSELDGPLVSLYAAHARALSTGDAAALDAVATAFADLGARL
ncbi:hypothetical protein GTY80_14920, partial [Amycolatopsis sp. SID8362]|nr:hypothetical protein [Amycolatopsis sp. SID8362]NED41234.1 hypothetical protein [Amycolatopsis sp. SID8362]